MKKKNGFTLVELLAVIVILSVVAVIGAVATISIKEKMNKKMFHEQLKEIITAAETYGSDNKEELSESTFTDYDLSTQVLRVSVEDLINSGYEKVEGTKIETDEETGEKTKKEIIHPISGESINSLVITVYETNESGRITACIKNINEADAASSENTDNQYDLLQDHNKEIYTDVYCIQENNYEAVIKDIPSIKVTSTVNDLNDPTNTAKTIKATIKDIGNNLTGYEVFKVDSTKICDKSNCSNWTSPSNAKEYALEYQVPQTEVTEGVYIKEEKYCICAKDSNNNMRVKEVTVKNIDTQKPNISKFELTIDGNKVKGDSIVFISDQTPEGITKSINNERYKELKFEIVGQSTKYTINQLKNLNFETDLGIDVCKSEPVIKAVVESRTGMKSDELNATLTITGCHKITLNPNGGNWAEKSGFTGTVVFTSGTTHQITYEYPVRDGYSFQGWAKSNTATTAEYNPGDVINPVNADYDLYAVWKENTYTVIYEKNNPDATSAPSPTVVNSSTITLTTEKPTFTGATFIEWNTKSDGTGTGFQPGQTITLVGNTLTVFAIWQSYTWEQYNKGYDLLKTGSGTKRLTSPIYLSDSYTMDANGKVSITESYKIRYATGLLWKVKENNTGMATGKYFISGTTRGATKTISPDTSGVIYRITNASGDTTPWVDYTEDYIEVKYETYQVKTVKKDKINTITEYVQNKYPDNGVKGDFWYVKK